METNIKQEYGYISISISNETLCISSIDDNLINPDYAQIILEPGQNIFKLFKSFMPVYADYPALNALLTDFKMLEKGGGFHYQHNPVTFKNNNNFLDNIVRFPDVMCNEFTVTFANSNVLLIWPLTQNNDLLLLDEHNKINPSIIKHELANSLNIINMSSILLNSGLNSITGPNETITKLDKYSQIIKTELENTISLLNTVNKLASDKHATHAIRHELSSSVNPLESRVKIHTFYEFILSYLTDINKLYPIYDDGQIYIDRPGHLNSKYISIQLPWIKIILDNIFKNIYGHLGNLTNKKFKSFDLTYNDDLQQLIINIYNELTPEPSNNITKCELYNELRDKYNLIHSEQELVPCKQYNSGQGLNLINILCSKLNISWSLMETSETMYLFKLAIPVHNSAIKSTSSTSVLLCRRDYSAKNNNKYNIYLNDRLQNLHTTTI